jgi:hypothetical protein
MDVIPIVDTHGQARGTLPYGPIRLLLLTSISSNGMTYDDGVDTNKEEQSPPLC